MKRGKATYLQPVVANPAAYTITVQVTDSSGCLVAEGKLCLPEEPDTIGDVLDFRPVADLWVDETRPDLNLGGSDTLWVNGAPVKMPYLRFEVTGLTAPVQSAWVELEAIRASADGGAIHIVSDNTWDQFAITYNNRPVIDGPVLDTVGAVAVGDPILLDVTPAISQNGSYSFAIVSSGRNGWAVPSRKGSTDTPVLFVALEPGR